MCSKNTEQTGSLQVKLLLKNGLQKFVFPDSGTFLIVFSNAWKTFPSKSNRYSVFKTP